MRTRWSRALWKPLALLLALMLAVAACGGAEQDSTEATEATEAAEAAEADPDEPDVAGTVEPLEVIRWAGPGPVVTLDGSKAGDAASMNGIYLTSGQLTRFNPDREPVLDLAESVELSEDGLQATVTLLPDITYSDGTPILAEDVAYAIERNREGTGASMVATVESVEVVDDRTAIITTKGSDPDLLSWMAERGWQLHPKSLIEADPEGYWENPVSGGPYMVEEDWTPGADLFRAVENPNYPHGPMMAKAIEHVSVPDVPSRILQLNAGEIDMAYDLPLASIEDLNDDIETTIAGVGGMNYVILNQRLGGPFASKQVRQAISLAIDRQRVSDVAFFGLQPPATAPFFDCGYICSPNMLPNNGERDLDAAQALMEEAGYADGFSADMKVSSGRGGWPDAAVLIAEDLADLNIDIEVTPVDEGQHYSSITEGNFEMFFSGGGGHHQSAVGQMLSDDGFWVVATGATPPEGAAELVQESASTLDPDARREVYDEVQRMWADMSHVISVVERVQLSGHQVPNGILVPQVANDQKINVQTVAQAEAGVRAGDAVPTEG